MCSTRKIPSRLMRIKDRTTRPRLLALVVNELATKQGHHLQPRGSRGLLVGDPKIAVMLQSSIRRRPSSNDDMRALWYRAPRIKLVDSVPAHPRCLGVLTRPLSLSYYSVPYNHVFEPCMHVLEPQTPERSGKIRWNPPPPISKNAYLLL